MTQPAFSRRIRALEEWLGAELFDRTHQPLGLTPVGQWFVSVAQRVLADLDQLPEQAQALSQAHSNTLRFASTHALSFTFLPKWLRTMESRIAVGGIELVSDVFNIILVRSRLSRCCQMCIMCIIRAITQYSLAMRLLLVKYCQYASGWLSRLYCERCMCGNNM